MTHKVEKVSDKAKRSMSKTNLSGKKEKGSSEHLSGNPGYAPGGSSATLPNKFDLDANFNSGFGKTGSFRRSGSDRKNRDPGVQSDDEDDMFKVSRVQRHDDNEKIHNDEKWEFKAKKKSASSQNSLNLNF